MTTMRERLRARDTLMKTKEVADILGVSQKRVEEVVKPIKKFSGRRKRFWPEAVLAILEGGEQPAWTCAAEFIRRIPDTLLTDANVAHYLAIPKVVVPYLPIEVWYDGRTPRYSRAALALFLEDGRD